MKEIAKIIIENVLEALYQPLGFSLILSVLFMFVYMFAEDCGWTMLIKRWIAEFKSNITFRKVFFLIFYFALILFRTLLNRNRWLNSLHNVIGIWGLRKPDGELTTEVIENLALFIPFTILLLWCFREKILGEVAKLSGTIWKSMKIVFLFSLTIEFLQLFLRLGTFQLSDLFYNTLGGLIGGVIYWIGYRLAHRDKK